MRLALLLPLWLALVIGDPGFVHSCPLHGGHGAAHGATHGAAHAHGAMHHEGSESAPPTHAICTCIGGCCVPTVPSIPRVVAMSAARVVIIELRTPSQRTFDVATDGQLRLPFPNAPPSRSERMV